MQSTNVSRLPSMIGVICTLIVALPGFRRDHSLACQHGTMAADTNPGTEKQPLRSVQKAVDWQQPEIRLSFPKAATPVPASGQRMVRPITPSSSARKARTKSSSSAKTRAHARFLEHDSWHRVRMLIRKAPRGRNQLPGRRM